jgi:PPOX class probable F420-dependent enzyme
VGRGQPIGEDDQEDPGMRLTDAEARRRFGVARVARLATVTGGGQPHVVPIVFALVDDVLYTAVDRKPKSTTALKRLANIAAHPAVAVLVDEYDDDWDRLWWVRADGIARVIDGDAAATAIDHLRARYRVYAADPPPGPVLAIAVSSWTGWSAAG